MPDPREMDDVGLFFDVPFADYRAWPGLNHSNIRLLVEQTTAHYRWACDHPEDRDTDATRFGRATHTAVLEPDRFAGEYIMQPKTYIKETTRPNGFAEIHKTEARPWNNNVKACKKWRAEQKKAAKTILTADQWREAEALRDAVRNHEAAALLLKAARKEVSMQWYDEDTGLLLKGRMDLWVETGVVADLKTTRCAAPNRFGRDAYRLGYLQQMVMYADGARSAAGIDVDPPIIIAAEKSPPYCVAVYQIQNEDDIECGRSQYVIALRRILECKESGVWAGYEEGLLTLALPEWAGQEIGG